MSAGGQIAAPVVSGVTSASIFFTGNIVSIKGVMLVTHLSWRIR